MPTPTHTQIGHTPTRPVHVALPGHSTARQQQQQQKGRGLHQPATRDPTAPHVHVPACPSQRQGDHSAVTAGCLMGCVGAPSERARRATATTHMCDSPCIVPAGHSSQCRGVTWCYSAHQGHTRHSLHRALRAPVLRRRAAGCQPPLRAVLADLVRCSPPNTLPPTRNAAVGKSRSLLVLQQYLLHTPPPDQHMTWPHHNQPSSGNSSPTEQVGSTLPQQHQGAALPRAEVLHLCST